MAIHATVAHTLAGPQVLMFKHGELDTPLAMIPLDVFRRMSKQIEMEMQAKLTSMHSKENGSMEI